MNKAITHIVFCFALLMMSCSQAGQHTLPRTGNAIYYWRTTFMLDSTERHYLSDHHIKTIYCRYFDVVMSDLQGPMPNASIHFAQDVPDSIELVPTIFIMNDCMQKDVLKTYDGREDVNGLAKKIIMRVIQMNETNEISNVHEVQIDCDYTARNRDFYYRFLKAAQREANARKLRLSVTIRLHQLSMPAPPVDYGILMLYNTGDPDRFAERNPILDLRDVQPYLAFLKDYPLPMGAAYPTFTWERNLRGVEITHTADFDDIARTKRIVEAERKDLQQLILTYHLDNENIHQYTPEQHEEIYHH